MGGQRSYPALDDAREDARRALASATSTILAGRIAGRLVATAMVGADGHRGWVHYLATALDLRGRGLGEAMMRAAETWAAGRGMPKLQLMVRHDNAGARGFYEAIGYTANRSRCARGGSVAVRSLDGSSAALTRDSPGDNLATNGNYGPGAAKFRASWSCNSLS